MRKTTKAPSLVFTCLLALLCVLRAWPDEPNPEGPVEAPSRICSWSDMEASIAKTFHVQSRGIQCFGVYDSVYILPSSDAVARMEKFRKRYMDGGPFLDEAKDCDDFAREATYFAKRWSYRHFTGVPATVAFGSAFVKVEGHYPLFSSRTWYEGYHVLNVYRRNDGQWIFFEPQTGKSEPVESLIYEGVITVLRIEM